MVNCAALSSYCDIGCSVFTGKIQFTEALNHRFIGFVVVQLLVSLKNTKSNVWFGNYFIISNCWCSSVCCIEPVQSAVRLPRNRLKGRLLCNSQHNLAFYTWAMYTKCLMIFCVKSSFCRWVFTQSVSWSWNLLPGCLFCVSTSYGCLNSRVNDQELFFFWEIVWTMEDDEGCLVRWNENFLVFKQRLRTGRCRVSKKTACHPDCLEQQTPGSLMVPSLPDAE